MASATLKRSIWQRLLGISATKEPSDPSCYIYTNGRLEIDLAKATELMDRGGAIRLEANLPCRVLVFRDEDGKLHAVHNKCGHAGRRLDPLPGTSGHVQCCSVGKSTFDEVGEVQSGSSEKDIKVFAVEENDGKVWIDLGQ